MIFDGMRRIVQKDEKMVSVWICSWPSKNKSDASDHCDERLGPAREEIFGATEIKA